MDINPDAVVHDLAIVLLGALHPSATIGPAPRLAAERLADVLGVKTGDVTREVEPRLRAALEGRKVIGKRTVEAMARRALMIFREDTTRHAHGGSGDYSATEAAVAAYGRAALIEYNEALSNTLEAYRAYYGTAELSTDVKRMVDADTPMVLP